MNIFITKKNSNESIVEYGFTIDDNKDEIIIQYKLDTIETHDDGLTTFSIATNTVPHYSNLSDEQKRVCEAVNKEVMEGIRMNNFFDSKTITID